MFYVVVNEIDDTVKFGITSGDPRPRLGMHARDGFDSVVRLVENLPDDLALRTERAVRAALRDAREAPVRGREYFPARVLGLVLDVVDGWTASPDPVEEPEQLALDIAS
ncbi:GIY-YIG nuclease family protein [Streptomyces prasinus]